MATTTTDPLARSGSWATTIGAVTLVLGILAMLVPGVAGLSVAMMLGIFLLAGGVLRAVWAFQARSFGKGVARFLIGALTIVCGLMLLANPLFATSVLTILLGVYFFFDGIFEITAAFVAKPAEGWGWLLFGGIVSLALGLIIWAQFPLSGAWAMGILVGIKLFLIGLIMIEGGRAVRQLEKHEGLA